MRSTPSSEHHRRLAATSDELHHAELRFTELSGRRAAIRERLETEWKRPLEEMIAEVPPVDLDDEALRAEAGGAAAPARAARTGERAGDRGARRDGQAPRLPRRAARRPRPMRERRCSRRSRRSTRRRASSSSRRSSRCACNFREIFMSLFGGGECDLRLENPDTPLDCDIEIHASPRGQEDAAHPPALERGARARRALAAVRHLPHEAEPLLPARRSGRAARRRQRRPLRADAQPVQEPHAVHRHHAQPAHDHRGGAMRCTA